MIGCVALIGLESLAVLGMPASRKNCELILLQCKSCEKQVSRFCLVPRFYRCQPATSPPRHPTAIRPARTSAHIPTDRKWTFVRLTAEASGTRYRDRSMKKAIPSATSQTNDHA